MQSIYIFIFFPFFLLQAKSIQDYSIFKYEVLFTNPICQDYFYAEPVLQNDGDLSYQKPKNVYCKMQDSLVSGHHSNSPQQRLLDWIRDVNSKDFFLAFLSFSDQRITNELCEAIKQGKKISLLLDDGKRHDQAEELLACGNDYSKEKWDQYFALYYSEESIKDAIRKIKREIRARKQKISEQERQEEVNQEVIADLQKEIINWKIKQKIKDLALSEKKAERHSLKKELENPAKQVRLLLRAKVPGLGFAHVKLFAVNKNHPEKMQLAYGSGNLSTGTHLHHENWHFVSVSQESYFARKHHCLIDTYVDLDATSSKHNFKKKIQDCIASLEGEPEEDLQLYIVPGEGEKAYQKIKEGIQSSRQVRMAAHRFFHTEIILDLEQAIERVADPIDMQLIVDDDIYWAGKRRKNVAANMPQEATRIKWLKLNENYRYNRNFEVRYMQTNHSIFQLHHNKFMIFDDRAVFTGAGNFTIAAFESNFENFYWIKIPEVIEAFQDQYAYMWQDLASRRQDLPKQDIRPE